MSVYCVGRRHWITIIFLGARDYRKNNRLSAQGKKTIAAAVRGFGPVSSARARRRVRAVRFDFSSCVVVRAVRCLVRSDNR